MQALLLRACLVLLLRHVHVVPTCTPPIMLPFARLGAQRTALVSAIARGTTRAGTAASQRQILRSSSGGGGIVHAGLYTSASARGVSEGGFEKTIALTARARATLCAGAGMGVGMMGLYGAYVTTAEDERTAAATAAAAAATSAAGAALDAFGAACTAVMSPAATNTALCTAAADPDTVDGNDGDGGGHRRRRSSSRSAVASAFRTCVADAVAAAAPSTVNITVNATGAPMAAGHSSSGSGFIISHGGLVATNAHVVQPGLGHGHGHGYGHGRGRRQLQRGPLPADIVVTLHDGRRFGADVVAADAEADLALLQLKPLGGEARGDNGSGSGSSKGGSLEGVPLPVAKLGTSATLRAGEWVVALGSPLSLQGSASFGIISAVARHSTEMGLRTRAEYLQTDAAVNAGNSGGPLVDLDGRVVGVSTARVQHSDGIAFAIPIDAAATVLEQLRKHGRVVRPYLGFKMAAFDAAGVHSGAKRALGRQQQGDGPLQRRGKQAPLSWREAVEGELSHRGLDRGVVIVDVVPDSPAAQAGLQSGDMLTHFDGKTVRTTADVMGAIGLHVGRTFEARVLRWETRGGAAGGGAVVSPREIKLSVVSGAAQA